VAAALGALAASGAAGWAEATMPALPCGFECQWPMGSHSGIPASMEVGVPYPVSVWYAWEEVPGNPAIGTAAGRAAPEGYYAWPDGLGPAAPPEGYAGSKVIIRLPEELELLGYGPKLERRLLWIDGNGRSTYEYTGTLAYEPGSVPQNLLLTFQLNSPVAYADTEVYVDLGLSERDAAPRVWIFNNDGAGSVEVSTDLAVPDPPPARSFAEELREVKENPAPTPGAAAWAAAARAAGGAGPGGAGPAGGAGGPGASGGAGAALVPELRHTYVYPPPMVTPLPESEMPAEARLPGAAGASAADQVIVWGQFRVTGRDNNTVDAANAVVCLYDRGDMGLSFIKHTGVDACRFTSPTGYYAITVPSTDPDGDGGPDIVLRLFAFNNFATVVDTSMPYRFDVPLPDDVMAGVTNLGTRTVPPTDPFTSAYIALSEITEAHEFFESEFGYDVPRVLVGFYQGAFYQPSIERITLAGPAPDISGRATVLHEYGHHVHSSVYGQNRLPDATHCRPHFFSYPSAGPCAWYEGWANFVPALVDGSPLVDRGSRVSWDIEAGQTVLGGQPRPLGHGDAVEGRISSLLWDLHDLADERGDDITGGTQMIWDALRGSTEASSELPANDIHEFREDWEARGYPGLGEAFALNTIPSRPPQPASLTVHAEAGGAPKSGAGARHASPGQSIVVTLGAAPGAATPAASFFGGAPSPMSPVPGAAALWRSSHAVTASTPEGAAVFRVSSGGTEYTPASITSGGNVVVDTTAPAAPTAEFTGHRSVVLEFGEPPLPGSFAPSAFPVTPTGAAAVQSTALHSPGSPRVVLDLATAVGAGAHTIVVPATLTDLAGNAYAGGAVAAENAHTSAAAPAFSVDPASIRPLASGTELAIDFSQGVAGSTAASEWELGFYNGGTQVGTAMVTALSAGSSPGTDLTLTDKAARIVLHTADPAPQGATALDVRHMPATGDAGLAGEAPLEGRGASAAGGRTEFGGNPSVEGARFVDARTVRLSLDRPLERSGGLLPFVDTGATVDPNPAKMTRGTLGFRGATTIGLSPTLGDTVVEYERGSREVTLHSSRPAAAAAGHQVVIPPGLTATASLGDPPSESNTYDLRSATVGGEGYSGALLPRADLVASRADTGAPSVLYAYADSGRNRFTMVLTGPLDQASADAAAFSISQPGMSSSAQEAQFAYNPGSLQIDLLVAELSAGVEYTATSGSRIRGESGVESAGPLSATATASPSPSLAIVSAEFVSPWELEVRLNRPIDPASAALVTVSGLGAVTQEYAPRSLSVTLLTELPAAYGNTYAVTLRQGIHDYAGTRFIAPSPASIFATLDVLHTAPPDTDPPSVILAWAIPGDPDSIRVLFDEGLSPEPTSGFEVRRVGAPEDLEITVSYSAPGGGGGPSRVDLGLGDHELLEGARYRVTVPPVSDGIRTSDRATVTVEYSGAPVALDAEFTGRNSLRLGVSEPLDPDTVDGIAVAGLGRTDVEYKRGSTNVFLRTAGDPVDGTEYEIRVPSSVTDTRGARFSDGGAGGSPTIVVPVTYDDADKPVILRAELRTPTATAVIFDEDVTFADPSRPGLRAAHWTVSASPGGSLGVGAAGFPTVAHLITSLDNSELLQYDSGRTIVLAHGPAPPRSAVSVSYAPGGDGGDVTDTASSPNVLDAATVDAADATPPSFTARTLTVSSTLVEFTRPLGGFTAASDWEVGGGEATRISHVGESPVAGEGSVFVPQGTASITLEHGATGGPGEQPFVSYGAPDSAALRAGTERLGTLSTRAADGIAPAARAEFADRSTILLTFTEPLDTATVAAGAFSVTTVGGGANLLAEPNAVTHHAGSPVVVLRLEADAAQSAHTVMVPTSVTDANGVAYATPDSPITATPPQGTPAAPFTARTDSISQTTVTFDPAVSGMTSASEWTVDGLEASGIVTESDGASMLAQSATLPAATASIKLTHRPLGSTAATPAVSYAPGSSPLEVGEARLAAHTAIATDGAGPEEVSTRTASRTITEVTFSEPVRFRGGDDTGRAGKWAVADSSSLNVDSVTIKPDTQDTTITITHAQNSGSAATPSVSYTATGDGSLEDAGGNGAVYADASGPETATDGVPPSAYGQFVPDLGGSGSFGIYVWLDEKVKGQGLLPRYLVPFSVDPGRPAYLDMPGLALAAEDGSDVPVYLGRVETSGVPDDPTARGDLGTSPKSRLTLFLHEAPVAGSPYTLTIPPALSDAAGNAFEETLVLTHGSDTAGPMLERAAFTGPRELYAEFDEPLKGSTVAVGSFTVKAGDAGANLLASVGAYVPHSRRVTMELNADATEGATYRVAATTALQDARGNDHAPGDPATATYDTTPPTASKAAFVDRYTLEVTVSEPLDVETVRSIRATGTNFGIFDIEYEEDSTTVTLNTLSLDTSGPITYPEARVTIPATVTDANGVAFEPTTLFTAHDDTMAPVPHTAVATSPTSTLVLFSPVTDRIRLGNGATMAERAAHWTVAETRGTDDTSDDTPLAVTDARVASDWHAILLSHDPSSGPDAVLSVRYLAGANDAGRVRDWADPPNVRNTDAAISQYEDRSSPAAMSISLSLLHDDATADASLPRYANEGDTITATLELDEPAGANAPTIDMFGTTVGMTASPASQSSTWTHAATVPSTGAAQGELAFEVRAWDEGGNAVTIGPADLPAGRSRITIDTMEPDFTARTAGAGVTVITFGEPVSGLLVASDWEVAGSPASGASASAAAPPSPALLLSGATSAALWHGPLASTSEEPVVAYARAP